MLDGCCYCWKILRGADGVDVHQGKIGGGGVQVAWFKNGYGISVEVS
jgi:hypothetical protein